jgi:hypothetical protein
MSDGIKIRMVEIDGEKRVPPECMRLLMAIADHRESCPECKSAFLTKQLTTCDTGLVLLRELSAQPEVSKL